MGTPPAVLLLDDGELDDVQALLQQQNIPFARIRGGAIVKGTPPPRDLLVSTPRRIDACREAVGDTINPPVRVMVVNEDSNALREQLRRSGFDYLVRRPVHNEALRLMLLHCVYKGEERRYEPRVAVGFDISFRTGMLTRRATLVDLSIRGCRLLSRHRIEMGKRIKVEIPEALETGEPIIVLGRVMRMEDDKVEDESVYRLGVAFERMDDDARQTLELIIEDLAHGPATLRNGPDRVPRPTADPHPDEPRAAAPSKPVPEPTPPAPPAAGNGDGRVEAPAANPATQTPAEDRSDPAAIARPGNAGEAVDRRSRERAQYGQTVPAFGNRALRVLVGRDLSTGGMRIHHQPELELGDRLHLAIYGEAGEEPLLIWGQVDRNDTEGGHVILFDAVSGEVEARLERLVADLPAVESLHDSEAEAMGTVVSEIVG